jgi:DNA-damage-inducible protein J
MKKSIMSSTTLQIRLDTDLRNEAESLFSSAGLDLTDAVRLFLRQSVIRRRLPFEVIGADPFYSEANQRALAESIRSIERGEARPHALLSP